MNRALFPALTLALLTSTPAIADSRLRQVMYSESAVVTVTGRVNVQASIMFGEDEVIENVAIGNSQAWQVTPNKRANILFVKPLEPRATTNLTVVTSKRRNRCGSDSKRLARCDDVMRGLLQQRHGAGIGVRSVIERTLTPLA